jgi:hypothetical protein
MSSISKFSLALVGLLVTVIVASRQIFLLVVFKHPPELMSSAGRTYHLWLVIGAGLIASVAGTLMFHFFSRHEDKKWARVAMTPTGPLPTNIRGSSNARSSLPIPINPKHGDSTDAWLSEGQAEDRMPMDGSVKDSGEPRSEQRAFARRSHQLMFKKWSQERHD